VHATPAHDSAAVFVGLVRILLAVATVLPRRLAARRAARCQAWVAARETGNNRLHCRHNGRRGRRGFRNRPSLVGGKANLNSARIRTNVSLPTNQISIVQEFGRVRGRANCCFSAGAVPVVVKRVSYKNNNSAHPSFLLNVEVKSRRAIQICSVVAPTGVRTACHHRDASALNYRFLCSSFSLFLVAAPTGCSKGPRGELRVFERRTTTVCRERSEHFKQSFPPLSVSLNTMWCPPTGCSKVQGGAYGCSNNSLAYVPVARILPVRARIRKLQKVIDADSSAAGPLGLELLVSDLHINLNAPDALLAVLIVK